MLLVALRAACMPTSLGLGVASLVQDGDLLYKSSCFMPFCFYAGAFGFVRVNLWSGSVCGRAFYLSHVTSIWGRDV